MDPPSVGQPLSGRLPAAWRTVALPVLLPAPGGGTQFVVAQPEV